MPRLVELPIIGQMDLRHHAQQPAAMDGERTIIECAQVAQRRADQQQRQQVGRGGDDRVDRRLHRVQQRGLLQQIADRVAGQAEFGEHRQRHRLAVAVARHRQDRLRVRRRIGQRRPGGAGGDTRETVTVKGSETHGNGTMARNMPVRPRHPLTGARSATCWRGATAYRVAVRYAGALAIET